MTSFFLDLAAAKYVELCRKSSEAVESWDDSRAMCNHSTAGHFVAARKVRLDCLSLASLRVKTFADCQALSLLIHCTSIISSSTPPICSRPQDKALRSP